MNSSTTQIETARDALALANAATMPQLVDALRGDALLSDRFGCPRCGGPEAWAVCGWRWRCDACRTSGTIALLARVVAEDPAALERLAGGRIDCVADPLVFEPQPDPDLIGWAS